jgi:hypothetical protein
VSVPTEKQYAYLRTLGGGSAIIVGKKRETEMYLRRGWVTAEYEEDKYYPYAWIRITPKGIRALADAVEKYGLPEIGPSAQKWEPYCGACNSKRVYTRLVDVDIPVPA